MPLQRETSYVLLGATLVGFSACAGFDPEHVKVGEDFAGHPGIAGGTATVGEAGEAGHAEVSGTGGSAGSSSGGTTIGGRGGVVDPSGTGGSGAGRGGLAGAGGTGTGGSPSAAGGVGGTSSAGATSLPVCGNGVVEAGEACDDGNDAGDDGCSDACAVEDGFVCTAPRCDGSGGECTMRVPVTYRDFNAHDAPGGHPDFQPGYASMNATRGLVESALDTQGKPVLSDAASEENGFMHGRSAFAEWFRDGAPSGGPISGELVLWGTKNGSYDNRWGRNGEAWRAANNEEDWGTPLFFPIDSGPHLLDEPRGEAKIPEQFGWNGWPWESDVAQAMGNTAPIETALAPFPSTEHNFSFTTEIRQWFRYRASEPMKISVLGDDDIWVFVNGHLVLDVGGWHAPLPATFLFMDGMLTAGAAIDPNEPTVFEVLQLGDFEIAEGELYEVDIFAAERQADASSFWLEVSGATTNRSVCVPKR